MTTHMELIVTRAKERSSPRSAKSQRLAALLIFLVLGACNPPKAEPAAPPPSPDPVRGSEACDRAWDVAAWAMELAEEEQAEGGFDPDGPTVKRLISELEGVETEAAKIGAEELEADARTGKEKLQQVVAERDPNTSASRMAEGGEAMKRINRRCGVGANP